MENNIQYEYTSDNCLHVDWSTVDKSVARIQFHDDEKKRVYSIDRGYSLKIPNRSEITINNIRFIGYEPIFKPADFVKPHRIEVTPAGDFIVEGLSENEKAELEKAYFEMQLSKEHFDRLVRKYIIK